MRYCSGRKGAVGAVTDGLWYGPNGKSCLPKYLFLHPAKLTHGKDHVSKAGMMSETER